LFTDFQPHQFSVLDAPCVGNQEAAVGRHINGADIRPRHDFDMLLDVADLKQDLGP
jgi:hypothetical protein